MADFYSVGQKAVSCFVNSGSGDQHWQRRSTAAGLHHQQQQQRLASPMVQRCCPVGGRRQTRQQEQVSVLSRHGRKVKDDTTRADGRLWRR